MGERFNLKEMEVTDEVFESEQSVVFDEGGKQNAHHKSSYGGNTWSIKFYVKKRRKMDQTAGDLRSLRRCDRDRIRQFGTFLLDRIAMQLMALAVGCGSIVNVVFMVLCYYKKKTVPSIIFMIFALLLIATFIMQIMAM